MRTALLTVFWGLAAFGWLIAARLAWEVRRLRKMRRTMVAARITRTGLQPDLPRRQRRELARRR